MALVPAAVCRRHTVLPVGFDEGKLVLVMADPANVFALDDVRSLTGLEPRPAVATRDDLLAAIDRYYRADADLYGHLNLDEVLSERAVVVFSLLRGKQALRRQALPADAERLDATLNIGGLPAGAYTVEAALKSSSDATARRLGTKRITINKVAGPFD